MNKLISSQHTWIDKQYHEEGANKAYCCICLSAPTGGGRAAGIAGWRKEIRNQTALAGGAVEAERSARSGSLAEAPVALVAVGESGS